MKKNFLKLLKTSVFNKNVFGKRKESSKDKFVTVKVKGEKWETIFLKSLFSHNACFFIPFLVYN